MAIPFDRPLRIAQPRHQHVAGPGDHREQRVVATDLRVPMVEGALVLEPVRLADCRIEVDREGCRPGSRAGSPGPGEEPAADRVELADVAPAEAAQERAQGGRRLEGEAQDPARAAGPEGGRVVDAVTTRERGHDERQEFVPGVGPAGGRTEVEVLVHELAQTQVLGQGGRQEEARVGDEAVVAEGGFQPVEGVG
jgi:hypothetical protein